MMRFFSSLVFIISMSVSAFANAEIPIIFSDLSAGVFRFQVKLAQQGNSEAQYKVGEMYETGMGVIRNEITAVVWYEKAAAQGHKMAGYKLLYLEIKSNGLNDFTKSQLGVLRQDAALGDAIAQYFLGMMYASGVGVPKSLNNALSWLNKATFNGVSEAEHDAIAVDEELARIREASAKKRVAALAAAKKRKAEAARLSSAKQKEAEKQRVVDASRRKSDAAKRKSSQDASARAAEERRRIETERRIFAEEKYKFEKQRHEAELERERLSEEAEDAKVAEAASKANKTTSFESDPCKGKSARFLSTCR